MTQEYLLKNLQNNPFLLAPMAGITDCSFRSFMREMGCGAVITELVSANGLEYSGEKTRQLMRFDDSQHPIGIQIFGERLELLAKAAKDVEQMGADFVDLNFGCPVPKVVNKGAGSAVLKDLIQLQKVLRVVKEAVAIPVTIKIRTGWDESSRNADQVAQVAYDEGITWVAIHGRTRAKGYNGFADWDYIRWVKENAKLPIIGNGDITTAEVANQRLVESACDGVMIGRGCLKNPWIFSEALQLRKEKVSEKIEKRFMSMLSRLQYHLERSAEERVQVLQIKKFSAWFSAGYPESANFRRTVFQIKEKNQLLETVENYFSNVEVFSQKDTSHEPFLMGGHG
ncbi:MAG: tRNA dihydrouridine synthase DusB [Bdellovibrionales bacterium]|nr:tRNA dihydrouridine synthase DusB [Bdellovibrionales bacterium]